MDCPECGARVPEAGSCRDNFSSLLALETRVPAAPGGVPHFLAVSSYVLQHPESMNYTVEALAALRQSVADQLAGRMTLQELRLQVRRASDGPARVTRRSGDEVLRWPVASWPVTVGDVLAGGEDGYAERVRAWADSVVRSLDAAGV